MDFQEGERDRSPVVRDFVDEILGKLPQPACETLPEVSVNENVNICSQLFDSLDLAIGHKVVKQKPKRNWRKEFVCRRFYNALTTGRKSAEDEEAAGARNVQHFESTSASLSGDLSVSDELGKSFCPFPCEKFHLNINIQKALKSCSEIAGKSSIPVLENMNKGGIWERMWTLISFIICIVSVARLCWFLDVQTKSNPITDGVQGVPVNKGPLPAVGVSNGNMLRSDFISKATRLLHSEIGPLENFTVDNCEKMELKEKLAFAYIVGQIAAAGTDSESLALLQAAGSFIDSTRPQPELYSEIYNNIEDPAVQTAVCHIKTGIKNCSEVVSDCRLGHRNIPDCQLFFYPQLTGKGLICVFNPTPHAAVEIKKSLRGEVSFEPVEFELGMWSHLSFDKISFSDEFNGFMLKNQMVGGKIHGLRFNVVESKNGPSEFTVTIANPVEPITFRHQTEELKYGKQHEFHLGVTSEHSSDEIRRVDPNRRNCSFFDERLIGNYKGYTKPKCLEVYLTLTRNCTFISDPEVFEESELLSTWGPISRFKGMPKLCNPKLWADEKFRIVDAWSLYAGINTCPKSCNTLTYKYLIRSDTNMKQMEGNQKKATVFVFFEDDEVEVRIKSLRRFIAEEIGIVLGMLGFCNDVTLPKILQFVGVHGARIVMITWIWLSSNFKRFKDSVTRRIE